MKKFIQNPHWFFFGLIPAFLIISFVNGKSSIPIPIFTNYYEFKIRAFCFISIAFFGLIGLNYASLIWLNKQPKMGLSIAHIILQTIALIPFVILLNTTFISNSNNQISFNTSLLSFSFLGFLLFLLATLIHLINFFTSVFSKSK